MKPYYQDNFVTLFHGDCLDVLPTLGDGWADVIATDPPYGTRTDQRETFMVGEFANVMPLALPIIHRAMKGNAAFYCFTSFKMMPDWLLRLQTYFKLQNIIIWRKRGHAGIWSPSSWYFAWEAIFYGLKGKREMAEHFADVIETEERGKRAAMQKPVDIMQKLIRASAHDGNTVCDPFAGTGSTLVAAKLLGRKVVGVEIEESHCEIAARRCAAEMDFHTANDRLHGQEEGA